MYSFVLFAQLFNNLRFLFSKRNKVYDFNFHTLLPCMAMIHTGIQITYFPMNFRSTFFPNCTGTDANRNFDNHFDEGGSEDDPCEITYHGPFPFSENNTQNIRDFVMANKEDIGYFLGINSISFYQVLLQSTKSCYPRFTFVQSVGLVSLWIYCNSVSG